MWYIVYDQGLILLAWIDLNPIMDELLYPL